MLFFSFSLQLLYSFSILQKSRSQSKLMSHLGIGLTFLHWPRCTCLFMSETLFWCPTTCYSTFLEKESWYLWRQSRSRRITTTGTSRGLLYPSTHKMVGNKHALQPRIHRPSPLQQVAHTRPLSQAPPTPGAVRDSLFWKRFSTAVHQTESSKDEEAGTQSSSRSFDAKYW